MEKTSPPPLASSSSSVNPEQPELSQSLPPYKRTSPADDALDDDAPASSSALDDAFFNTFFREIHQSTNRQQPELSQSLPKSPPLAPHSSYHLTDFDRIERIGEGEDDLFEQASLNKSGDNEENEPEAKRRKCENDKMSSLGSRTVREPRIVVQTTSDIDIFDDGYRWRKYGQKSYYRCTQVASHDLRAWITTYNGKHNHDVPAPRGSGSYPAVDRPSDNSNTTSTVYKVVHRHSGKLYAIKDINLPPKNSVRHQIRRNIENLMDLDNVNLVKCHHIWDDGRDIQILLEYMDKGSLKGIHINNEPALADLSRQVISGIQYLHHKNMCVPWLMPSKLLLNSRNQVKINVVGVSERSRSKGTASYMSPERIDRDLDHYDRCAADIWSLGVTILELYMGCSPFVGDSMIIIYAICTSQPPQAPSTASPEFREFISLCLQKDPAKRWNADQLLSHPFVTQILLPSSGYNNKSLLSSVLNSPPFGGWNVFLSFSGVDTRYNFTSHLYSALVRDGVPTFMDDTEMERGPGISDVSTQAIQKSKIYVVVFSENYAASPRCLDQLVEILQCSNSMGRLVLPIYYNIEPSVVRTQSGSFKEAFEQHENHFDVNRLDKWRIALMNVWNLSGYILLNNMSEADLINQVVDRALLELKPMALAVARYPVGLDSRVKDVTALVSSDTQGVSRISIHDVGGAGKAITTKRIGIHGMGGVGKTTLAKAVYNQHYHQFQGSCFLANIREVSGTETGLISLQQKLINDVLNCKNINIANVDQGIELIRARICSMKILIVFDDMDDPMPLEFLEGPFAFGSIILITTRNEDLLDSIKIEARYKVNELGDAESRQLFSQHAFGEDKISPEFTELSQIILQRAGGLPLALEVFGSNLFDQSEEGKICMDKLNQVSINDVEKKLMISYDALELVDPMLQDIFLDIACFFIGQKKEEVVKKIETCYSHADHNIEVLKKRCLVTFNEKNELGMHDLLRDMGRKIARNNSPDEPGKHSRLWVATDIYEVLKDHKGTESIEGIIPWNFDYQNALERVSFNTETFKMMCNLRFLQLEGYLTGSFEHLFEDLRWLRWDRCPLTCLPSEFYPQKLVILELPGSKIRKMFDLSMVSQVFENLKTLNLSYSLDLRTLPDFIMFPFLETINLEGCKSLQEVHISIGILARLVSLNLHGCVELKGLPDTICNLSALEVLNISGCINLKALPIELGDIESLKEFDAEKLNVSRLPDSIECLSKLVRLNLSCNHMNRLPLLSKMKGLEELNLTNCRSLNIIQGLEDLTSIRKLHLGGCSSSLLAYTFTERFFQVLGNLKTLNMKYSQDLIRTMDFTILPCLETLNLEGCESLEELHRSIGSLEKLISLNLCGCVKLKSLPDTLCNLRALKRINIGGCSSLEALPAELGNITSLNKLDADGLSILTLPNSIGRLHNLVKLRLSYNKNLLTLPQTICNLRALKVLDVGGCRKLEALPIELGNMESLEELNVNALNVWRLPDSVWRLTKLVKLHLEYSKNLETLPVTLSNLSSLESLDLRYCGNLVCIKNFPPNLKWIRADGCTSIERVQHLSHLKRLEILALTDCSGLKEIDGLNELISIRILCLGGCSSSLLADTLTKHFFQVLSGYRQEIKIYIPAAEFPDWISHSSDWIGQSSDAGSTMFIDLLPNLSHNFSAMILCFKHRGVDSYGEATYAVKKTTSGFIWSGSFDNNYGEAQMIIVPSSIFLVRAGDEKIELTADAEIHGIHLLH